MVIREANLADAPAIAMHVDAWRTTVQQLTAEFKYLNHICRRGARPCAPTAWSIYLKIAVMPAKFLADLSDEERETKWVKIFSNIAQENFTYVAEDEIGQI
ncbi:hypothetical protein PQG02_27530 [Nostoc sp. UHCC 0926]|uniref:hypothetical protein n=1 Tax=unclassified Nostoc TaxID=2593658 RepID=UPI00235DFE22|nr:hypothetical protein [Nostoc sp. UHCC 0926]WDD32370.1 hypothetical protein PQG02_27530 [Nostoc sp. UHCC 0926]